VITQRIGASILLGFLAMGALAQDTAVFKNPGSDLYQAIADAIVARSGRAGLGSPQGPIDADPDAEKSSRLLEDIKSLDVNRLYTIGSGATALAVQEGGFDGIYVYIPNPYAKGLAYKGGWSGIAPYPEPAAVLAYPRGTLEMNRVVLVYTRRANHEVAKVFQGAARDANMGIELIGVKGAEDLPKELGPEIPGADGVLVLLDPLAFSSAGMRYIVTTCMEGKKPVVTFKDELAASGATLSIYPTPEAVAQSAVTAMKALSEEGEDKKLLYPQAFAVSVNDAALQTLGLKVGEKFVAKHY